MAPAEANSFRFSLLPASPIFVEEAGGDEPFAFYSPTEVWILDCIWLSGLQLAMVGLHGFDSQH
jgi:hypothetical protein